MNESVGPPLSDLEQAIHDLIMSKGNEGILLRSIKFESKLPDPVINKALKTLLGKSMIKEVKHTGRKLYMGANYMKTGALASIPCGMCPRIALCTPGGAISPPTCVYYNKWLDIQLNKS